MNLIVGEGGVRLIERRLIGPRIDLGGAVALFDELSLLEVDAGDQANDLAADCRRIQRRGLLLVPRTPR
jgi:hypothetical protein